MKLLLRERLRRVGLPPLLPALLLACCLAGAIASCPAEAAGTYTVTNTLDDGSDGTLRSAISLANADPGATIVFAPGVSGIIALQGAELDIAASMTILGPGINVAGVDGGGAVRLLNITSPDAQVAVSGLLFQNGTAFNDPNSVTSGVGGGIYNGGTLLLTGCALNRSAASYGGGIYNGGSLVLSGCTLFENSASGGGGGLYDAGTSMLTGCSCLSNGAPYAAGLYSGGAMTLTACSVSGNAALASADGNSGVGAGLYNDGTLTLAACVVSGNLAYGGSADNGGNGGSGAGLYSDGTLALTGCTVSGNVAGPKADDSGGLGGGLDNQGAATLADDIFYGDYAANAAEIENDTSHGPATVTASHCDIQSRSAGNLGLGPSLFGPTNLNADPLFVSAPTDLHLRSGSPCIGRGVADPANTTDRDGNPRPDPPSIGAYEYTSPGLASLTVPSPVPGGTTVTATVTLNGVAATDTLVGLSSSDSSAVRVHRAVIIPAGSSSASFAIRTYHNPVTKSVTIQASLGEVVLTSAQGQATLAAPLTITGG